MTSPCAEPQVSVSVVMANYNGARFLPDAITSVQTQTLSRFELLICDDASTDESAAIAERYAAADPRIKFLRNEANLGPAAARNRALAVATGAWLAIMDSDDLMHPARLKRLIASAEQDGAAMVADDLIVFYQDGSRPSHGLLSCADAGEPFWVDTAGFVRSNTFYSGRRGLGYLKPIIRTDLLQQASCRYDETLTIGEDYDFIFRLLVAGLKYRVYPRQLYYYRKHSGSISHRLSTEAAFAMLDAERRFRPKLDGASREVLAAVEARSKSLETVLAFNALIAALKARRFAESASRILRRPKLLLLLREPLQAWFSRARAMRISLAATGAHFLRKTAQ